MKDRNFKKRQGRQKMKDRNFKKRQEQRRHIWDPKEKAHRRETATDTAEILDEATLDEMMELIQRVEEKDLPPKQIVLTHHIPRPRFVPDQQSPQGYATIILRYTPAKAEQTAAAQKEEDQWNASQPPTN